MIAVVDSERGREPLSSPRNDRIDLRPSPDDFRAATTRAAGPLADLGAPTIYSFNLDRGTAFDLAAFGKALIPGLQHAGLVLDLRGYPAFQQYQAAQHLIGAPFTSPRFRSFAGTAPIDGNTTGAELPGGFAFEFTGVDIAHRNGSPFNGVGILPDIEVKLTAEDFAAGRDPELEAAVKWLLTP